MQFSLLVPWDQNLNHPLPNFPDSFAQSSLVKKSKADNYLPSWLHTLCGEQPTMLPNFASLEFIPMKLILRNSGLISTWLNPGVHLDAHPSCQKHRACLWRASSSRAFPVPFPFRGGSLQLPITVRPVGSADARATWGRYSSLGSGQGHHKKSPWDQAASP